MSREGITVEFARTQKAGLEQALLLQPNVVVVNLAEAQFTGMRLCQAIGRRLPNTRRLLIADRNGSSSVPCDLRLVRPFTVRKLREAIFNLLGLAAPQLLIAGCLELDVMARLVTGPNGQHELTPKQSSLLMIFMQHPNQVISRKDLMDRIWETAYLGDTRTLDVHIRWLREKIELNPTQPTLLLTRRGIGYMLSVPEDDPEVDPDAPAADGDDFA